MPLETGLPEMRVRGEAGRTCGQLRMFAKMLDEAAEDHRIVGLRWFIRSDNNGRLVLRRLRLHVSSRSAKQSTHQCNGTENRCFPHELLSINFPHLS